MTRVEKIRELWRRFDRGDFDGAAELLPERFAAVWPQTREVIRGRRNFIELNRNYPGRWKCEPQEIVAIENRVISVVKVHDDTTTLYAISFYEFEGEEVVRATEYFADEMDPPFDRTEWTETMED